MTEQIKREEVVQAALVIERWCNENFEKNKNGKCDCPFCKPPYDEDLCRFWPCKPRVWDMEAFLRTTGLKYDAKVNRHYTIDGLDKVVSKLTPSQTLKEDPFPFASNQNLLTGICSSIRDYGIASATTTEAASKIATSLLSKHGEPPSDNQEYTILNRTLTTILLNLEHVEVDDIEAISDYTPEVKHTFLSKLFYILITNGKEQETLD